MMRCEASGEQIIGDISYLAGFLFYPVDVQEKVKASLFIFYTETNKSILVFHISFHILTGLNS